MRLAAEVKMGFYPVSPGTIELVAKRLTMDDPGATCLLDPCCGKGQAVRQLADLLGVPVGNTYGVELDMERSTQARQAVGHVQYASYFSTAFRPVQCFSLAWLNPPYDNEPKQTDGSGQPIEAAFVEQTYRLLQPGGVLVLHAPVNRLDSTVILDRLHTYFTNLGRLVLPPELMPYGECVIIGTRRSQSSKPTGFANAIGVMTPEKVYPVHATKDRPREVEKLEPTEEELVQAITDPDLWKEYRVQPEPPLPRPLLPLNAGHLGLFLAGGGIDGLFSPEGWQPHVVRGVAYKTPYVSKEETESNEKKTTHTTVVSQRICMKVRALSPDGSIVEFK
jgi:SAM-dependent methyltransferase